MLSKRFAAFLFLSSYAPAFVIVALLSYEESCLVFVTALVFAGLGLLSIALFFGAARKRSPITLTVQEVENRSPEVAAYAATYLLPFISNYDGGWRDLLALGLFFSLIAIIHVNSGVIYINPLLALLGFHLLAVRTSVQAAETAVNRRPQFLLTKERWLTSGDRVKVRALMPDALISLESDASDYTEG